MVPWSPVSANKTQFLWGSRCWTLLALPVLLTCSRLAEGVCGWLERGAVRRHCTGGEGGQLAELAGQLSSLLLARVTATRVCCGVTKGLKGVLWGEAWLTGGGVGGAEGLRFWLNLYWLTHIWTDETLRCLSDFDVKLRLGAAVGRPWAGEGRVDEDRWLGRAGALHYDGGLRLGLDHVGVPGNAGQSGGVVHGVLGRHGETDGEEGNTVLVLLILSLWQPITC